MNKKRKRFLYISGGAICLAISVFVLKLILESPYRTQLPAYPDFQTLSASLQEQISVAGNKAYRNPSADNLGMLGMVYHSSAYYDKAAQCYRLAVQKNNEKWIWSYYLGYLNLELGESKSSIENFRRVLEENPQINMALFYTGEAFQNLGLSDEAEKVFVKIADLNARAFNENSVSISNYFPLRTYAMFQLARIYMNTNRLDNAEQTLKEIIQNHITFGPAYRLLGNVYAMKGDLPLSRKYAVRANDLTIYMPPVDTIIDRLALMSRSEIYLMKQIDVAIQRLNPKWAMDLLNNTKQYFPESKFLISKAIKLFLWVGKGDQALPYLDRHIKYFREDFNEMMEVAELLYDNGFKSEAMTYFFQAKKLKTEDTAIQSRLALWLGERGMIKDALSLINEQLEKDQENVKVLTKGVYLFQEVGEKGKAITYLNRLKRLTPLNPEVKKLAGMSAEKEGKLKEAIAMYEEAFKGDPKDLSTIQYLGNIYLREKMWSQAIRHFRRALEYHPNDPYLLEGLGKLLVFCPDPKLRNIAEGKEYSERAFIRSTSPSETQISAGRNLAAACAELGNRQEAYTYMNITVDLARRRNVSKDYLDYLESLLKQFSFTN